MSLLHLHLKSGRTISVRVEEFEFKQSGLSKTLRWTTADRGERLVHVDIDEVVAITETERNR